MSPVKLPELLQNSWLHVWLLHNCQPAHSTEAVQASTSLCDVHDICSVFANIDYRDLQLSNVFLSRKVQHSVSVRFEKVCMLLLKLGRSKPN